MPLVPSQNCSEVNVHEVHATMQLTDAQGVVDLIRAFLVKERSDRAMVHRCELIRTTLVTDMLCNTCRECELSHRETLCRAILSEGHVTVLCIKMMTAMAAERNDKIARERCAESAAGCDVCDLVAASQLIEFAAVAAAEYATHVATAAAMAAAAVM
jgi:hypothetical protein